MELLDKVANAAKTPEGPALRRLLAEVRRSPDSVVVEGLARLLLDAWPAAGAALVHTLAEVVAGDPPRAEARRSLLREVFRQAIVRDDELARSSGADGLAWVGNEDDVDILMPLVTRGDTPLVRVSGIDALSAIDPQAVRRLLPELLSYEENPWVRSSLLAHAYVAGLLDHPPDLGRLLEDGFDVAGIFIRTADDLLTEDMPAARRRELANELSKLLGKEPPPFVAESAESLLAQLQ